MRKLLLGTTALIAAASVSSAVMADMTIKGAMEFTIESQDPGTTVTGASNNLFSSDQNITMTFTNKTDSGLTIGMVQNIESVGDGSVSAAASDENYMYIKGGFGALTLGNNDGAGDQLTTTASDLVGPDALNDGAPAMASATGNLADDNADLINDINDENSITYILPKMGGLTIGASYSDKGAGAAANADQTVVAAKYEFSSGAVSGSLHYGSMNMSGANAGDSSLNSNSMGIKLKSGNVQAIMAKAEDDVTSAIKTEVTDFGVQYKLSNGLTLSAVSTEVTENTGGESLDVTTIGGKYSIASGLDAYLTYHDYDYAVGTSGATADDGTVTSFTLKASF